MNEKRTNPPIFEFSGQILRPHWSCLSVHAHIPFHHHNNKKKRLSTQSPKKRVGTNANVRVTAPQPQGLKRVLQLMTMKKVRACRQ